MGSVALVSTGALVMTVPEAARRRRGACRAGPAPVAAEAGPRVSPLGIPLLTRSSAQSAYELSVAAGR